MCCKGSTSNINPYCRGDVALPPLAATLRSKALTAAAKAATKTLESNIILFEDWLQTQLDMSVVFHFDGDTCLLILSPAVRFFHVRHHSLIIRQHLDDRLYIILELRWQSMSVCAAVKTCILSADHAGEPCMYSLHLFHKLVISETLLILPDYEPCTIRAQEATRSTNLCRAVNQHFWSNSLSLYSNRLI